MTETEKHKRISELWSELHELTGARALVYFTADDILRYTNDEAWGEDCGKITEEQVNEWLDIHEENISEWMIERAWDYITMNAPEAKETSC